ncbi:uncharacterized protein PG998_009060 [Apiospora kogelbergensis]|uniref:uncharacterized protein n=1 Tax=Apiospora kogelbergensis TaxID=1337665 RepID=UPI00312E7E17
MLPPVDESVLTDNPGFDKLYKSLSEDILNPDGSTKNDAAAKERDAVRQELKQYRLRATRQHLLKQAISNATPQTVSGAAPSQPAPTAAGRTGIPQHQRARSHLTRQNSSSTAAAAAEADAEGPLSPTGKQQQLPPELVDLLLLLPDFLEKAPRQLLPQSDLRLLLSTRPFSRFPTHLPKLTPLLSKHLTTQAAALTRVLHPTTNASFLHRHTAHLPTATSALVTQLTTTRHELTQARLRTTTTLLNHLDQHARALAILVRALEAKHGPAAHSTALRSQRACLEAALWAASLRLLLAETKGRVYPAGSGGALANYRRHLRDQQMRLEDASRVRERELEDYGVVSRSSGNESDDDDDENEMSVKERRMREMARIWREMEGRLAEIQADLDRLGRS